MKYYCNPINVNYRYQFNMDPRKGKLEIAREAADPSMICFIFYIFPKNPKLCFAIRFCVVLSTSIRPNVIE